MSNTRAERRAARELIDGRLVATRAPQHGSESTYVNWSCRCEPCTKVHSAASLRRNRRTNWKARRWATRVLVGGRLIAVEAAVHGSASTYKNWGCRCHLCTDAQVASCADYRAKRRGLTRVA